MKPELTIVGAACAVCCAPLIVGAVVASPAVAAAGGVVALAAGATAAVRRWRKAAPPEPLPQGDAELVRALAIFALAGLAEVGGGWLLWQWMRESRPWPLGLVGALVLISYGVIATFQADPHLGRVYAAYGGIFIVMAMAWGYLVDGFRPDRWDMIGAAVCLVGVLIIFFGPRGAPT